ncbi:MAG: hypothetical protein QNJ63_00365 [Calothrix sp. MO_192.B10]|nr:hypothetical protein [Calothrix sp. MO_192.B10]
MNKYKFYSSQQINQSTESLHIVTIPKSPVENPSAWIQDGTSPTEIILAVAVVIVAVSSVIGSVAYLAQVLVTSRKGE